VNMLFLRLFSHEDKAVSSSEAMGVIRDKGAYAGMTNSSSLPMGLRICKGAARPTQEKARAHTGVSRIVGTSVLSYRAFPSL
jgi:hypothetical protein